MAREFGVSFLSNDSTYEWLRPTFSRVAQLLASVPDKARLRAPTSLSSQYPYSLMSKILCWFIYTCIHLCGCPHGLDKFMFHSNKEFCF